VSSRNRAVFRLPAVSFLLPFLGFVAVTPLANAGAHIFLMLYVLPLLGLIYIVITRTVADEHVIKSSGFLGFKKIRWSELDGFEFRGPRWATAVALDGRRMPMPMVRPRDLPRLAVVSGGRLLIGKDAPAQIDPDEQDIKDDDHAVRSAADQPVASVLIPASSTANGEEGSSSAAVVADE